MPGLIKRIERITSPAARQMAVVRPVACALFLLASIGCAPRKKAEIEIPRPRVSWSHITPWAVPPLNNQYRVVVAQPTQGLFPANIAVTRVALRDVKPHPSSVATVIEPVILKDPRNEFLKWNTVFDDQMAVSEVFPIDQFALGGGEAIPEQVVASFRALHARLGLIYAVNELNDLETEMIGTLYDTVTAKPVAHFQTQAHSVLPPDGKEPKPPIDLWTTDSKALARADFEHLVYECVRELILNDQPAAVEAPTGWQPVLPRFPVAWPPQLPNREQ